MGFYSTLTRLAILAMALAFYDLFLKEHWLRFAADQTGGGVGFGTMAIGYFLWMGLVWLFTYFYAHRIETEVG